MLNIRISGYLMHVRSICNADDLSSYDLPDFVREVRSPVSELMVAGVESGSVCCPNGQRMLSKTSGL